MALAELLAGARGRGGRRTRHRSKRRRARRRTASSRRPRRRPRDSRSKRPAPTKPSCARGGAAARAARLAAAAAVREAREEGFPRVSRDGARAARRSPGAIGYADGAPRPDPREHWRRSLPRRHSTSTRATSRSPSSCSSSSALQLHVIAAAGDRGRRGVDERRRAYRIRNTLEERLANAEPALRLVFADALATSARDSAAGAVA